MSCLLLYFFQTLSYRLRENIVFRDMTVEEEQQQDAERHRDETCKSQHAVGQIIATEDTKTYCAGKRVESAVEYGRHDDRLAFQNKIQFYRTEKHAHQHHHQHTDLRVLRIVVSHQDDRRVPDTPDNADEQRRRDEFLVAYGIDKIVAPAILLAEGKQR